MTPMQLIQCIESAGLRLTLSDTGTLQLEGNQVVVNRWLPSIREHKAALVDYLQGGDLGTFRTLSPTFFLSDTGENDEKGGTLGLSGLCLPHFFSPPSVLNQKQPPALPPGYPPLGTSPADWTPEQREVVRRCFHGPTGIHLLSRSKAGGNHEQE